jgi:hypothetical protein
MFAWTGLAIRSGIPPRHPLGLGSTPENLPVKLFVMGAVISHNLRVEPLAVIDAQGGGTDNYIA